MKQFWAFFDKLLNVMAVIAGVILVFICGAVCYTIGMRYLFNKTTIWIMQTTEYALCWIVFLATTWLLRDGGHITTDIIYSHLNKKTRRWLDIIMFVISGIGCCIMFYYGMQHTYESITRNITDVRAVTIPKWTVFCIVPFGSLLLTIQFLRMAWGRVTGSETAGNEEGR
jgi:TRAP-type C4-dicarboxylate transport system permease small subunit